MVDLTKEHLRDVRKAGACAAAVDKYRAGMEVCQVRSEHLAWVEDNAPEVVGGLELPAPLWSLGSPGYGDGSGSGYGYGYGDGDGYGYGFGYSEYKGFRARYGQG